jgi:CheY-like chemotaxis protein
VEDNEMNQMVAQKVLSKWGFKIDIAENGKHAIEKLSSGEYDLILMDIQMPEMDGYEATQFIRKNMQPPKAKIPIIAMTAHAIVGEAEKCIALGMDDYISKPFNQKTLYEKINHLMKTKLESGIPFAPREITQTKTTGEKYTDLTYLMQVSEGSQEFMKKMITAFLLQTPQMLEDMTKFMEGKKWSDLRAVVHKMKPSIDFVGLRSIRETIQNLEKYSAEEINLELIPEMIHEVKIICKAAMEELEKEIVRFS